MRRIQLISLKKSLERAKGFEPSTPTLARSCSILYRRNHECPEGLAEVRLALDLRTRRAGRRDASKKPLTSAAVDNASLFFAAAHKFICD
jgi:hypothetical protein